MEIRIKRFLSLAMAVIMVFGMLPTDTVFATETEGSQQESTPAPDSSTPEESQSSENNEPNAQEVTDVAQIGDVGFTTLQAAIDACVAGNNTITLLDAVTENVTITQKDGVNVVIDGNGKTFTGVMTVFGDARRDGAETLTIKNVEFVAAAGAASCIVSPDRTAQNPARYSYSHNVTVENCTFTDPDGVVDCAAIRHEDGGDKNWTVKNCTVDATMHSLLQVNNVNGKLVIDGCTVKSKNGANLNSCTNVEITNSNFDVQGYAVRAGVKTGGNLGEAKTYVLNNNTLKSACADGDAVIMFRASAVDTAMDMEQNVVSGTTHFSGTTEATKIDADANYWDGKTAPVVDGTAVAVETYYADAALETLKTTPKAGIPYAYVGESTIWGQTWTNASESYVLKFYNGTTLMGTSTLNTKLDVPMDGDVEVTWHISFDPSQDTDAYWIQNWEIAPSAAMFPDRVVLCVDGTDVSEGVVQFNGPDSINKVYAATTDADGKIVKFYNTLSGAMANANGNAVVVVRDVTEEIAEFTNVTLVTTVAGGVTITNTKTENWISMANVNIGKGVTLDMDNAYYTGAGVNIIEGTLKVGTLYNANDSKTTVKNGGKIITTGMIVNRYHNNADSGIYVYGDGDASTVEVSCADTIGTYSGTFYAKDAVVEGKMLWIDYKKDQSEEADKYSQSTPKFENSVLNVASELRLYKDATLTLVDSDVTAGKVQIRQDATPTVSVDGASTIKASSVENLSGATMNAVRGEDGTVTFQKFIAMVGGKGYTDFKEALNALTDGATLTLLDDITVSDTWDCRNNGAKITASNVTIDGSGHTLKLTGTVDDKNWNTVFRFEGDNATIKNLTIDASAATGIQRGISAKLSVTVDNCTFIGNGSSAKRAIIFGEGADDALSTVTATVTGSKFVNWSYGVSDNQSGKDAKAVTVTGSTFENSAVLISAHDTITFTGNTMTGEKAYARISSYTGLVNVNATGNTLTENSSNIVSDAVSYDNVQSDFAVDAPVSVTSGDTVKYYNTLAEAVAAAREGDTITVLQSISEGTIKLPAALKNVTFKGTEGAVLKDMTVMAADGNAISYEGLTFDGLTFENSRISITGWRTGGATVKDLTVTNCTFKNLNDTTNSAPLHINMDATEAVENLTFTNNVIDGATGGSKSGVYAQVTGKTVFTGNTINNVSFRPYVIQLTTDDGIADEFIVTGNTFSGSAAGRAQGLGNNAEGTDTVKLVVSDNIFKDITSAQQICYWNFNPDTTTADLSKNYYDIDIAANPDRIYFNSAAQDAVDLYEMGVYPYYDELNTDGTINKDSLVEPPYVAQIGENKYVSLQAAIDAVQEGDTITLLDDVPVTQAAYGQNALNHARAVSFTLNLNGYTLSADTGNSVIRFNLTGSGATSDVTMTIKNGKIVSGANTWCTVMASGIEGAKAVMNLEDLTIENNKGGDFAVKAWANGVVNAKNVIINASYGGGFYALGGEITLDDCTVNQKGLWTAPYNSMAIGVSNGGKMTVNSGSYTAVPAAEADGGNQGTSHGSWCGGVMSSGGTLVINGGTFSNGNIGGTASNPRELFIVGADADYGDNVAANLIINNGTFNSIGDLIHCETIWGSENDSANTYMPTMAVAINGGDFTGVKGDAIGGCDPISTGNPVEVMITGGTYSNSSAEAYLTEDYELEYKGGKFTVKALPVARVGADDYTSLVAAIEAAAESGETIFLMRDVKLTETITIEKPVTLNLSGKTITGADGAVVLNIKAETTIKNGTIKGNKGGTSDGLINIYADLKLDGVTLETSKINALRFKAGACTAELTNCNVTGAFKGYGGSVWVIKSGTYQASSTAVSDQLNGTAAVYGGTFHYAIDEVDCANGYVTVKNDDGTYTVKYAPAAFIDTNNNGVLDAGEAVYGNLDQVFANHQEGDVHVVLTADIVANGKVDTDADAHYYFTTNVAEGVKMDFLYADNWNYVQKMSIGKNITLNAKYFLGWTDIDIYGTLNTDYAYFMGADATVHEGGLLKANTGDATVQVKDNAKLTVNGTVNTATLNVWVNNAELVVSGANAKVEARWIDIWDGAPSVVVENGATLDVDSIKASRGGDITVADATLDAASIEIGHNGESAGKLTETGNSTIIGEIKLTAADSAVVSDGGLSVTTELAGMKVVYEEGQYKVVPDTYVAVLNGKYMTLADAFAAAQNGEEIEIVTAGTYALGTSGKDIIITGAVDGVVFDNIGAKNMGGANVTFNNVTFDYYPNVDYTGLQHSGDLVYNNCTFNGQVFLYGTSETFNGCTFNQNSADAYNVWTYTADQVAFNECTFNSAGKSVLIYNEDASEYNKINVVDCDFVASTPVDGKAAIEMDSSLTAGIELTIDAATTATGFGSGNVSGNSLWNNKKGNEGKNNDITVTVNEEVVLQPIKTAEVAGVYYTTVKAAMEAAKTGDTVTIFAGKFTQNLDVNKDITVIGETDADGKNQVNFNGKLNITADGATVKNINFDNGSSSAGYIGAKDVLVEGCSVVGGNGFRSCYTSGTVTFKDSTITGATYGIHFDGSADGNIVIDNCVITGWTSFAATIKKVTMTDTTFEEGNYNQLRFYQDVEMTDVKFNPEMTVDFGKSNVSADFDNCTVSDGSDLLDVIYLPDQAQMGVNITVDDEPIIVVAMIDEECYLSMKDALEAVEDGETITVYSSKDEHAIEIDFTKDIEFTITGEAPNYKFPVVTFQNATVNIKDAEFQAPELDARQNATINVIDSKITDCGGNSIVKSYYNGAINISGNSEVYTMQVTTMGYITVSGAAKLHATWQTNVYGNGMITVENGATFNTAALHLTGQDYSGRDNTDADRVGKPAAIIVDGATFTVGKVLSSNGADYSYNSSKGINIGTVAGKNAVLDIKNGATVNFWQENGKPVTIGADGIVNVAGSTFNVAVRGNGAVKLTNKGTVYVSGESNIAATVTGAGWFYMNGVTLDADTNLIGAKVRFASGTNNIDGSVIDDGYFQVGIGAYNGVDANVDTVNGVIVNVKNATIGANGDTYAGWIGTGFYDTDAEKAAAMTDAKYILNIEDSVAEFGYLHISNDGELNVNGNAAEKVWYNNSDYSFYAGEIIINGTANFADTDVLALYTKVSCDNGTDKPGTLNVNAGTEYEAERHNGAVSGTNFVLYKTGVVNVAKGGNLHIGEHTSVAADAVMNVGGEVTALGTITNNGKIYITDVNATLTTPKAPEVEPGVDGYMVSYADGAYKLDLVVAMIGDATYATLQAAIDAAAEGDTVTVMSDIELTETVTVPAGKVITLDLNGKTVSMNQTEKVTANHTMIANNGNLTIQDTAGNGKLSYQYTGENLGTSYSANTVTSNPGSVLTVKSGTIENLTFDSATIAYAIDGLTNGGLGDVTVNIEGGTITSERQSVRIFANSTTNTGTLNISGGDITGRVIVQNANANANKAAMSITGGTFNTNAYKDEVLSVGGNNGATIAMVPEVKGGTFNGKVISEMETGFISGGSFSDVSVINLLADGYTLKPVGDMFTPVMDAVAKVGGKEYATLQAAINAAGEGDTVYVLKDIELVAPVTVAADKKITLDLMGSTVSYETDVMNEALITNNGDLTITGNGTITFAYVGAPDTSYGKGNYTVVNGGKLTVENGTIANTTEKMSHAYYTIQNGGNGEVIINGGKIVNETSYAIRQFASGSATNTVTVNGGEVTGTRAVWMQAAGSDAANAPAITLNVNGGTLTSTGYTSGGYEFRDAVYSYSYGDSLENVAINVTGGTIDGDILLTGGKNKTAAEKVTITDGIIEGVVESYAQDEVAVPAISITGGTFASNFSEKYATDDGYKFVENADGKYILEKLPFVASAHFETGAYAANAPAKPRDHLSINIYDINVKESLVVKIYDEAGVHIATTSLRAIDRDDETNVYIPGTHAKLSMNAVVAGKEAGSWDTVWHVAPSEFNIPKTFEVYADGILTDTWDQGFTTEEEKQDYINLEGVAKAVAKIGDVKYRTLQAAINAADVDAVITLLADVAEDEIVTVKKPMTIHANGFTITEDNVSTMKYNDGTSKRQLTAEETSDGLVIKPVTLTSTEAGEAKAYVDLNNNGSNDAGEEVVSLQAALDAAAAGQTVRLTGNLEVNATVIIPTDVTLDIQGYTLTVKTLVGLNGSKLTATAMNTAGTAGGKLVVAKDNLVLSKEAFVNGSGYAILPVWDDTNKHYLFSLFFVQTTTSKQGLRVDEENESIEFVFAHQTSNYFMNHLLHDGGFDNGVKAVVEISWDAKNANGEVIGTPKQTFVYTDEMFATVEKGGFSYTFNLKGYSAMDLDISTMKIVGKIVTDSGVEIASKEFTIADNKLS